MRQRRWCRWRQIPKDIIEIAMEKLWNGYCIDLYYDVLSFFIISISIILLECAAKICSTVRQRFTIWHQLKILIAVEISFWAAVNVINHLKRCKHSVTKYPPSGHSLSCYPYETLTKHINQENRFMTLGTI